MPHSPAASCYVRHLGLIDYGQAWELQRQLVHTQKTTPTPDWLLLAEHPPVYTLGQGASLEFLRFDPADPPHPLYRIERGGEVTHHCPGQLVGYPVLQLKRHRPDLHWYLRQLEAVIIQTLAAFGLVGERVPGRTGVWIGQHKLAAIGIKVSRWVTMHGFALNVCPDLSGFEAIVPCGISDATVGTMAQFCPGLTVATVEPVLLAAFAQVFNLQLVPAPAKDEAPLPTRPEAT